MPIAKTNGTVATTVGIAPTVGKAEIQLGSTLQTAPAPVSRKLDTGTSVVENRKVSNYEDTKSRRILVQGITQAVVQSPIIAGLGYTDKKQAVDLVKEVARELIAFVDEESK